MNRNLLAACAFSSLTAALLAACGSSGGSTRPIPISGGVPAALATPDPAPSAVRTETPSPSPAPSPRLLTAADQNVVPVLTCIQHIPSTGRFFLRLGYNSTEPAAVVIPVDAIGGTTQLNHIVVTPADGSTPYEVTSQPTQFAPGATSGGIDVTVNQKDVLTWYLDGNVLVSTTNGAQNCP